MRVIPIIFSVAFLAWMSGCAQNLKSHTVQTAPTIKNLDACHLSVKFSGSPDVMPDGLASQMSYGMNVRVGVHWMYLTDIGGVRRVETASCTCPSKEWLDNEKMSMIHNRRYVEGVGMVSETLVENLENGVKMTAQTTINSESDCVVVQTFTVKGSPESFGASATQFFSSIAPIVKPAQSLNDAGNKLSTVERLRQLDLLLKESLITRDEFDTRRSTILQSL